MKFQYFGSLIRKNDSLENIRMLGKIEGKRSKGQQRMRWLNGIIDSINMGLSKLPGDDEGQGSLECCSPWGCKELDMNENNPIIQVKVHIH